MCLAIPGLVKRVEQRNGAKVAKVNFGGVVKYVNLEMIPETCVGQYVLVHAGVALTIVNEEEAMRTLQYLEEAGEISELNPNGE